MLTSPQKMKQQQGFGSFLTKLSASNFGGNTIYAPHNVTNVFIESAANAANSRSLYDTVYQSRHH